MKASILILAAILLSTTASATTTFLSYTGTLNTPEDVFEVSFSLTSPATIDIQTFGFGGGTNAAGMVISPGGFDPMVALFSGPPATASIVTVAGSPAADADTLFNPPFSFVGNCPPAGMVTIGTGIGSSICGDDLLQISGLPAGTYTLVLTDANYFPSAVNPGPPISTLLSDGFTDLTGGAFQTCNDTSAGTFCVTRTGNFAVDIVDLSDAGLATPEPGNLVLLATGLGVLLLMRRHSLRARPGRKRSRDSHHGTHLNHSGGRFARTVTGLRGFTSLTERSK